MVLRTALPTPVPAISTVLEPPAAESMPKQQRLPTDFMDAVFPRDFSLLDSASQISDGSNSAAPVLPIQANHVALTQAEREKLCQNCHSTLSHLQSARETRNRQRWARNPADDNTIVRLAAGCIPILRDGRVLLVSSRTPSAKSLNFPKGGWETDECIEQGALRETFEEAGVLGVLGPPLSSFLVESKNKRKEATTNGSMGKLSESASSGSVGAESSKSSFKFCDLSALAPMSVAVGETLPVHTHTCLTFFPMYVTEVKSNWPEHMRERRAYPIEEAIRLVRPEFRWMLEHLQEENVIIP